MAREYSDHPWYWIRVTVNVHPRRKDIVCSAFCAIHAVKRFGRRRVSFVFVMYMPFHLSLFMCGYYDLVPYEKECSEKRYYSCQKFSPDMDNLKIN